MTVDKLRTALQALNQLLDPETPTEERKVQLAILKERFRIDGIYDLAKNGMPDDAERPEDAELAEIRGHLEPLGLAPEGTPLPELARLAALAIVGLTGK
jgi:hypothetical protein